jgi:hypothetical protein
VLALGLFVSFFLPWVNWNGYPVRGSDLPGGYFFRLAKSKFHSGNPFPRFDFLLLIFWLIPAGAVIELIDLISKKKRVLPLFITAVLSLVLLTIYFEFSKKLVMLGTGNSVWLMLQPACWFQLVFAAGLILFVSGIHSWLKKLFFLLIGPVLVVIGFQMVENYLLHETFPDTAGITADYSLDAANLLNEFTANDSLANRKYAEKNILIRGKVSGLEINKDSTINVKFTNSLGSYLIFTLEKKQYEQAKNILTGDSISVKGSCSGSIYSEILGSTCIAFKRSVFIKQ